MRSDTLLDLVPGNIPGFANISSKQDSYLDQWLLGTLNTDLSNKNAVSKSDGDRERLCGWR